MATPTQFTPQIPNELAFGQMKVRILSKEVLTTIHGRRVWKLRYVIEDTSTIPPKTSLESFMFIRDPDISDVARSGKSLLEIEQIYQERFKRTLESHARTAINTYKAMTFMFSVGGV